MNVIRVESTSIHMTYDEVRVEYLNTLVLRSASRHETHIMSKVRQRIDYYIT